MIRDTRADHAAADDDDFRFVHKLKFIEPSSFE
jgi:hypothetical protein